MNSISTKEGNGIRAHYNQSATEENMEVESHLVVSVSFLAKLRKKANTISIEGRNYEDVCFVNIGRRIKNRDRSTYGQQEHQKEDKNELKILQLAIPTCEQVTIYKRDTAITHTEVAANVFGDHYIVQFAALKQRCICQQERKNSIETERQYIFTSN